MKVIKLINSRALTTRHSVTRISSMGMDMAKDKASTMLEKFLSTVDSKSTRCKYRNDGEGSNDLALS